MRHKNQQAILAALSAVLFAIALPIHAEEVALTQGKDETPRYEWTEGDALEEWDAIMKSPHCRDEDSRSCRELMFQHYCKYSDTSFYASACAGEKQLVAEVPLNEWTEWDAIMKSPHCIDEDSKPCIELKFHYYCKYSGSSRNANACAGGRQEEADKRLLSFYQSLLNAFRELASQETHWSELPTLLATSQEAWTVYREKECNFVEQYFKGGTIQPALWSYCMREESEKRLQSLKKHAEEYGAILESHNITLQRDASPQSGSRP